MAFCDTSLFKKSDVLVAVILRQAHFSSFESSCYFVFWCSNLHVLARLSFLYSVGGSRDGVVVRALASHRCGPGSIPEPGVTSGLSLLLVLVPAPRVFLRVLRFPSLHKNQHSKFRFDPGMRATGLSALLLSVTLTK